MAEESNGNNFFDTEYLKADLKGRSVRGGVVTVVAQMLRFCLRLGSMAVLGRLLTPDDFGLIAMVTAVTGFVMLFKDLGLSMATVQRSEINHIQISTLFWINVVLSVCIMLLTALLAPAIAWFYSEPRLTWITLALVGGLIFSGLSIQHQALLRRQMRFGILAFTNIISQLVGIVAAVVAASYGAGYWALVIMQLSAGAAGATAVWVASGWLPGLPGRRSGVRKMLAFGGNLTGFSFLNYFAVNMDNVLIGRFWGPSQLGLYNRAYNLLLFPIRQITAPIAAVAVPALSRLQDESERYRRYYYRAINVIAFLSMPLVVIMAALSKEIIRIVLGEQWVGAAVIFKVLAFAAFFQPVFSTTVWIYVSLGQTKRMMHWAFISVPVIILSFIIGLPWGVLGVAVSYTICTLVVLSIPSLWWAFRYSPISIYGCLKAIYCPLVVSVVMYSVVELMRSGFALYSPIPTVLISSAIALGCFVLVVLFWQKARREVFAIVSIMGMLRRQKYAVG